MRTTAVSTAALALLLSGATLAFGQPGAPPPKQEGSLEKAPARSKLEEMLAQAVKNNPDIRVAAAKLGEAEAELNRVRLQVMQKVVTLYHTAEIARTEVATAERALAQTKQLSKNQVVSSNEVAAAETALAAAKAKLAAVEAEVPYVTGQGPRADAGTLLERLRLMEAGYSMTLRLRDLPTGGKAGMEVPPRPVHGPLADRIRKALDEPVSLRVTEGSVADVLRLLREKEPALTIKYVPRQGAAPKLTFELKDLPLGAALEYLEDSLPDYTIVMREYGLLLTVADRVPPDAVPLRDFWKKRGPAQAVTKNPPAKDVEGVVKRIDPRNGLVTISIGSDAGLVMGNTLEVFRTTPAPKYLGTIQVLDTRRTEAVCRPFGHLADVTQAGDRVASRLKEK